jgi:CO/xanthine dehydrogenase Mo-binding subunit
VLSPSEKTAVGHFRTRVRGEVVTADENLRLHGLPHNLFSYAAHLVGLEIDELTGKIDVKHYVSVSDCGNVMNPQVYEQQIQGGIGQGIGYALCERLVVAGGEIMNPNFAEYILPSAQDVPDMHSISVSLHEPTGPFGLKGVGEISMNGPLPAISNAVTDAIGVRITKYPMTPDRIFMAMRSQKERDSHH